MRLTSMSDGIDLEVDVAYPVSRVRAGGVIDVYAATTLRDGLLRCLVEQPVGIAVEVTDARLEDEVALTVLAGVAREAGRWPGTRLAVGGASDEFAAAAARMAIDHDLRISRDLGRVLDELRALPRPPSLRLPVAPDRDAPGHARAALERFCRGLGVGGDLDAAYLVASELVTNAVVHAGTQIDVTLRLVGPMLHIAVRDRSPAPARIVSFVDDSAEAGRGLLLVDALATAWGTLSCSAGKVVWATVRLR
jgi:hypothetical protein